MACEAGRISIDGLAAVTVQFCRVTSCVYGPQSVAAGLRLASTRLEHERVGVDAA